MLPATTGVNLFRHKYHRGLYHAIAKLPVQIKGLTDNSNPITMDNMNFIGFHEFKFDKSTTLMEIAKFFSGKVPDGIPLF